MLKTILYTVISATCAICSHAASSRIETANIQGYQTADGTDISTAGILGVLILDAGGDGFNSILDGTTISTNTVLGDGNDIILNVVSSDAALPPFSPAQIAGTGTMTLEVDFTGDIDPGDQYAIYWFPTLTTSSGTFTAADTYGLAREADWVLGGDGALISTTTVTNAGVANLLVASPIPEPSSTALLGLASAALLLRRRRK